MKLEGVKIGDKILTPRFVTWLPKGCPRLTMNIYTVVSETKTMVTTADGRRFRKSDGKMIGESYVHGELALAERLTELVAERDAEDKHMEAYRTVQASLEKRLHHRAYTTAQLEVLVEAFERVEKMGTTNKSPTN